MSKTCAVTALLVAVVAVAGVGPSMAQDSSPTPPKNLKRVGDHWTPWDPPQPGPDSYIIQKDDTLWDLAHTWFGDPFLWPQIWDENRYILDSHWIYPGDPLVVPGRPTVVGAEQPPADDTGDARASTGAEREPIVATLPPPPPAPPPLLPAADQADLYCTGFIAPSPELSSLWVAGRESERLSVAEGDVVYLNHGRDQGIRAGDEFGILRPTREVAHPISGQPLGTLVRRLGKLRVMLAHDRTATAVIEMSCEDVRDGDALVAWSDIPVPMLESLPPFDRHDPTPSGGPTGRIVAVRDDIDAVAAGHVVFTDLGQASGVSPGDVLTLFRAADESHGLYTASSHGSAADGVELPRTMIGQAVVLTVGPTTSTAKIQRSVRESHVGDAVEVWR